MTAVSPRITPRSGAPADAGLEQRLESLEGTATSRGTLHLASVRAGRFPEESDVQLTAGSARSPVVLAKCFGGRAEAGVAPWVEAAIAADDEAFHVDVVAALAALLPAGGRLMIVYGDGETERLLRRGVPPVATPVGTALFAAGCTWFKDWYFAEGGREGEAKLQGNKPPDAEVAERQRERLRAELRRWLAGLGGAEDMETERARERAERILRRRDAREGGRSR